MNPPDSPAPGPWAAGTFAERLRAMRQDLDAACRAHRQAPLAREEVERLKQEIIVLFREADAAVRQAAAWKDSVKALAEQWKQLDGRPGAAAASARVDHLGASTYLEKGWSKLALLDAEGAERAFRQALELAPGNLEAEALLSWAVMLQERPDEALHMLQSVLQRDPHQALAHVNVGYICLRKRLYGEAIEHLSSVIRADRDRRAVLYAHLYLGLVYRERDMYDDAVACLRRALELGPNLMQAWYELGRTLWFAARRADAVLAWKTGSEANKFSPWGKRCAEMLQLVEQGGSPPRDG
jgi:tetratricopeptide (TPR) repeat protein